MVGSYRSRSSGEARQRSQEVAQRGQQKASEYAEQGREKAKGQIATQKERASGELQGIARALQQTGSQLREQDQNSIGQYAEQAAEQVERLSNYLSEKDSEQLISEVEDFARQRPTVFLGGAVLLGAVAARFLKSSAGQTGNLREELKQEAREVQQSVVLDDSDFSSGESSPGRDFSNRETNSMSMREWKDSIRRAKSSYQDSGEPESR